MTTDHPETTPERPGVVPATVQVLTGDRAREQYPDLFGDDDDDPYFNDGDATGNAHWVDYVPDLVLVVTNPAGRVVMASNASERHMTACGYVTTEEAR